MSLHINTSFGSVQNLNRVHTFASDWCVSLGYFFILFPHVVSYMSSFLRSRKPFQATFFPFIILLLCKILNFFLKSKYLYNIHSSFPGGSEDKASSCNAGDPDSIPGLGRSPWEDPLEKEMTTHSSILAWRIPWTEEPVDDKNVIFGFLYFYFMFSILAFN